VCEKTGEPCDYLVRAATKTDTDDKSLGDAEMDATCVTPVTFSGFPTRSRLFLARRRSIARWLTRKHSS